MVTGVAFIPGADKLPKSIKCGKHTAGVAVTVICRTKQNNGVHGMGCGVGQAGSLITYDSGAGSLITYDSG